MHSSCVFCADIHKNMYRTGISVCKKVKNVGDTVFTLSQWCSQGIHACGVLLHITWYLVPDILRQCSGLKTLGRHHPETQHHIPQE
jgi:hypothetical protein